jgi:uncharacterized metal-binding protein
MPFVTRAMPVLFACQGCPEFGQLAGEVGAQLDERRLAEAYWIGAPAANLRQLATTARSRFPVFALDGCARHCAKLWLAGEGVKAQRHFTLGSGASAKELAARLADRLTARS